MLNANNNEKWMCSNVYKMWNDIDSYLAFMLIPRSINIYQQNVNFISLIPQKMSN
jgi:hypothetical protein